ncbi:MAG: polysaccharide biosynthesis protein [Acidobacteriaceae bacterium]
MTSAKLTWIKHKLGLDRAIIFTVLARGWLSFAGLVTVFLIAHFLTLAEQGYYYTFGSLVALQIVFELGFSFVILQMASHETAHLVISSDGQITGDPVSHARLASVLQKSIRWYSIAALLMLATLIPAGFYFFSTHAHGDQSVAWRFPWCLVVIAATLTFQIDPIFSFLEGCGYVSHVARTRFAQAFLGSLLAWAALLTHHGLFAPAMMITGQAIAGGCWLFSRRRLILSLLGHTAGPHKIKWGTEVWPFQWRIAVSWLCGYFIFQLFNPVLFAYWGPAAAGQMGMSLNISNALMSIAIAWINTKSAPFGTMVARKEYEKLDHVFFTSVSQALVVVVVGALAVWSAARYLSSRNMKFSHRLLDPLPFGILLITMILNIVVSSEALYLRAHKQEKFLLNSVVGAILVGSSTFVFGKRFGATGMVIGYLAVTTVVGVGYGAYTFLKYRRIWHAE